MASNALSKAESNALSVSYEVLGTRVELDLNFVKRYLVRGQADRVTDQELVFFMNTCKMQKLNPLASGEVYCIKFGSEPAQMVIGKDAYLRRAFSNPDYLYKEDGITVQRGNEIIQKEGCCLYPGEKLIGGWCKVHFMRNSKERTAYKEVSLEEYNKGQANWKTKPATMIDKVAVSQCVRDAFPKDYEGLYSEDEMVASGAIPVNFREVKTEQENDNMATAVEVAEDDPVISQEQRQAFFKAARTQFGKDEGNEVVKSIIEEMGLESTTNMRESQYIEATEKLMDLVAKKKADAEAEDAAVQSDE
jgi:phage recombination protein Bet|nr:MAG TPA: RecT protein [Caudoviricetes sp.]